MTEATARFPDFADRVHESGDEFLVERDGQAVCRISPASAMAPFTVADLVELLKSVEGPDSEYASDVEEAVRTQPPAPRSPWDS